MKSRLYGFKENWPDGEIYLVNADTLDEATTYFIAYKQEINSHFGITEHKLIKTTVGAYLQAYCGNATHAFSYLVCTYIMSPGVLTEIEIYE